MAAITENTNQIGAARRVLHNEVITNQVADTATVRRFIRVPGWAANVSFYIFFTSQAGSGETFDFDVEVPDFGTQAKLTAPDDGNIAIIKSITALTGAGPYVIEVHIGPDVEGTDAASATADSQYYSSRPLPPVLSYAYTTTDSANDADYAFDIVAVFRP